MLELLLSKITQGGTFSLADLAREFNVSQAQMEQMILHLERTGYLKSHIGCDSDHCPGCTISAGCKVVPQAQLWSITNSGSENKSK